MTSEDVTKENHQSVSIEELVGAIATIQKMRRNLLATLAELDGDHEEESEAVNDVVERRAKLKEVVVLLQEEIDLQQ